MSVDAQQRLVGQPDGVRVEIDTSGRTIRPFFELIDFERSEDERTLYCGQYMLAPRLDSGDVDA